MRLRFPSSPFFGHRIIPPYPPRSSLLAPAPRGEGRGEAGAARLCSVALLVVVRAARWSRPLLPASETSGLQRSEAPAPRCQVLGHNDSLPAPSAPPPAKLGSIPLGPVPLPAGRRRRDAGNPPPGEGLRRERSREAFGLLGGQEALPVAAAAGGGLRTRDRPPSQAAVGGFL